MRRSRSCGIHIALKRSKIKLPESWRVSGKSPRWRIRSHCLRTMLNSPLLRSKKIPKPKNICAKSLGGGTVSTSLIMDKIWVLTFLSYSFLPAIFEHRWILLYSVLEGLCLLWTQKNASIRGRALNLQKFFVRRFFVSTDGKQWEQRKALRKRSQSIWSKLLLLILSAERLVRAEQSWRAKKSGDSWFAAV